MDVDREAFVNKMLRLLGGTIGSDPDLTCLADTLDRGYAPKKALSEATMSILCLIEDAQAHRCVACSRPLTEGCEMFFHQKCLVEEPRA
jgi:hypothetical protein